MNGIGTASRPNTALVTRAMECGSCGREINPGPGSATVADGTCVVCVLLTRPSANARGRRLAHGLVSKGGRRKARAYARRRRVERESTKTTVARARARAADRERSVQFNRMRSAAKAA